MAPWPDTMSNVQSSLNIVGQSFSSCQAEVVASLQSYEEPAVRCHLHEKVLLMTIDLAHALVDGKLQGGETNESEHA